MPDDASGSNSSGGLANGPLCFDYRKRVCSILTMTRRIFHDGAAPQEINRAANKDDAAKFGRSPLRGAR